MFHVDTSAMRLRLQGLLGPTHRLNEVRSTTSDCKGRNPTDLVGKMIVRKRKETKSLREMSEKIDTKRRKLPLGGAVFDEKLCVVVFSCGAAR